MDGNKDEALKCLKIAKDSIRTGDKNRALKFLNKALRLDPSIEIDDFLSNHSSQGKSPDEPTDDNPSNPSRSVPHRRVPPSARGQSSSSTYSEEQATVVREIKRKKDYYEILGLEKSCCAEDIRKAYKKISLKVHPDKNKAPGAEEAFKVVSKAFQCLSDEDSRKRYDLVGSEEPVYERRGGGVNGMRGFRGFYDGEVDAEEIFRNFFSGGMHPATTGNFGGFSFGPGVRVRTGGVDQGSNWLRTLIQLLPVILLLLVNLLPSSEPIYSLSRSYSYDIRFITPKGVNYYVKSSNFDQQYPPDSPKRVSIEQRVDDDYHSVLVHNCRLEWQQLHWGYRRETPNCDALKRFEAMAQ